MTFDFGSAIDELKAGERVQREGWNGKGMWLELQVPDEHSKMTLPYIFMSTAQGDLENRDIRRRNPRKSRCLTKRGWPKSVENFDRFSAESRH